MKILLSIVVLFANYFFADAQSQNLAGGYQVNGYFFHPSSPRALNLQKQIFISGSNPTKYTVYLADLGNSSYSFSFSVDSNNNLVNWHPEGSTPASPASNFMSSDNPGGFVFYPGITTGFVQATYNNKYDPATKTFYMHYGYDPVATGQNGFTRQIYEKYVLVAETPSITSFTPKTGTYGTSVTITGHGFLQTSAVYVGTILCDTFNVVSDSVIGVIAGAGGTGKISVTNDFVSSASIDTFTYTPPVVNNTQWQYLGTAGFSTGPAYSVNMALSNNIPYVVYVDSGSRKAIVRRYTGSTWENVGTTVSDGKCSNTMIAISNNTPFVSYTDSANGGLITVKKFNGNNWVTVGNAGFGDFLNSDLALDGNGVPYVNSINNSNNISVYKFNGTSWVTLGLTANGYKGSLAINKLTNIPYIFYGENYSNGTVMKYNGANWEIVGNAGFADSVNRVGIYYPCIIIDKTGNPIVAFQDDNGFERISVYKLNGSVWTAGNSKRFSKSHSYFLSFALDKNNLPVFAFDDASYNNHGTVMYLNNEGMWKYAGDRGFAPTGNFSDHALAIDTNNVPLIAFADPNNGNKVSVMQYKTTLSPFVTAADGNWNNPAIWLNGVVPSATSQVTINKNVIVTTNTSCYSLKIEATVGNLIVNPGVNLTVMH